MSLHKYTGKPRRLYPFDPDTSPPATICYCKHRRDEHCGCGSACLKTGCVCDGFVRPELKS